MHQLGFFGNRSNRKMRFWPQQDQRQDSPQNTTKIIWSGHGYQNEWMNANSVCVCVCVCVCMLSHVWLLATSWTIVHQAPLSIGCHFLLQGIFPAHELNPCLLRLLHWQEESLSLRHLESPECQLVFVFLSLCSRFRFQRGNNLLA